MHPAAHAELPIRLPLFAEVFGGVSGFVFQTHGERHLVEGLFPVAHVPQVVMGLGVEESDGDPEAARAALGVGQSPYILCVGRVDDGKGTGLLASWFGAWKDRAPGDLKLVLAGTVLDPPPAHPDVIVAGPVDEATKWGGLRGALGLVQPSPHEAFSIVLMEGWTAGLPALVNGACVATREHCERSGGGLWFTGYATFEAAMTRLASDAALRRALGDRGRGYVERSFRWPGLIRRYAEFLTCVAERAGA
jgi:glycosyltransferase involved in cell wall biosynthesis